MQTAAESKAFKRRRTAIASGVTGVVAVMLALSFAAVPLYKRFCAATGFGGTTQRADASPATGQGKRSLVVRFDSNVAPGLPWSFEPETSSVTLRTGKTATVYFRVKNNSNRDTVARAAYNVAPTVLGEYFDKISCFCFTDQRLAPGESAEMPVVFFLNPALEDDETVDAIDTVTLSYTFFVPKDGSVPVAETAPAGTAPARSRL